MKTSILLLLLFLSLLQAQEASLEDLLSEYREANELYLETKENRSGHIILFSRSDLDKMQAYTLNDVLKTLRMFTLKSTRFGMSSLVKTPYSEQTMSSVKIFIDSYELTSMTSGTGLAQFGKMGLNFIDHIEVYQSANAVVFSGEPGDTIIKLYTKKSFRENATVFQASIDSKKGSRAQLIEADNFEDYSYLANFDISKNNFKKYSSNMNDLSRDGYRGQFYLNLSKKDDFTIEAGSSLERYDIFSGFGSAITDGLIDTRYHYIQFSKYFSDSMKLILSSTYEEVRLDDKDANGIPLFDNGVSNDMEIKTGSYTNGIILEKRDTYKDHTFLLGTQLKRRTFFLDKFKSDSIDKDIPLGPKCLDIYMLYFEDTYNINESNRITVGAKIDYYKNSSNASSTEDILRIGYIGNFGKELSLKMFVQKDYNYPIFAQTTFSPIYMPNPDLKSSKGVKSKIEAEYKKDYLTLTVGGEFSRYRDGIVFDTSNKMYVNNDRNSDFNQFFINTNYKFDADNKIIVEYFKAYKENFTFSSDEGALLQLYNRSGRFDIYNELIYRSSFTSLSKTRIDAGYDYTFGAIYHYDKKLDLKFKAENVFDKASKTDMGNVSIQTIDRRAIFTVEYIF